MNEPLSREAILLGESLELPAGQRAAFLDEACGVNSELRRAVQVLLEAHEGAGAFLETAATGGRLLGAAANSILSVNVDAPAAQKLGDRIGRYKLLEQIGEGGCGVVYMAEQEEPVRRRVALKVIKLGMDTKQVIARFEAERQALALMDHQNIAKVLDAGATETGRPYFVMELVRGIKITEYCDQNNLTTRERLDLFSQVCRAIQHAHQKGIIHRDIKPSNILVTLHDGVPVPKVIDFGIAKATQGRLTDQTLFTAFQQFIGTPAYMSPEQAEMSGLDIDTRTDIYSLGVLLYELLTGKTPFDAKQLLAAGLDEMRRTIRETEPVRPSTRLTDLVAADVRRRHSKSEMDGASSRRLVQNKELIRQLRGELDWIIMRCLEKDRVRRYETPNDLAADIQRHLKQETVMACPPSPLYRFRKLVRRNKLAFAATAAIAAALLVGLGVSTWMFFRERAAHQTAVEQARLRQQAESARINEVRLRLESEAALRLAAEASAQKARSAADRSEQATRFFKKMLEGVGPAAAHGGDVTILREILDNTARDMGRELTNQPAIEAELRTTIGNVYGAIGEYEKEEAMHRKAQELRLNAPGTPQKEIAVSLSNLAIALERRGKLAEAESTAREALAKVPDSLGTEHDERAHCLNSLAMVLHRLGKLSEAEDLYHQALALRKQVPGDTHLPATLNNLALLLRDRGNYAEAEKMYRESLTVQTNLIGPDAPYIATTLNNLAVVLQDQKKPADAEGLIRQALEMTRKFQGDDHPDIATWLNNLAKNLLEQGKLPEAELMFRDVLARMKKSLGDKHPDLSTIINNVAFALWRQNKLPEAEEMYQQALAVAKQAIGEECPEVARAQQNLGYVLRDQGRLGEAELMERRALDLWRKLFGDDHVAVANALRDLTDIFVREHKLDEAENFFNELVTPGAENRPPTENLLVAQVSFLAHINRLKAAATAATRALVLKPESKPLQHLMILLLIAEGDRDGYRLACQRALARFEATNDPNATVQMSLYCLALPGSGVDLETIGKLAGTALELAEGGARKVSAEYIPSFQFSKGLAEYRQGHFASAIALMTEPLKHSGHSWSERLHLEAYMLTAMADWQMHQHDEARDALAKGLKLAGSALPDPESGILGKLWQDKIIACALMKEARAMIEVGAKSGVEGK